MKFYKLKIVDEGPRKDDIVWQMMDDNYYFIKFINDDGTDFSDAQSMTFVEESTPPFSV